MLWLLRVYEVYTLWKDPSPRPENLQYFSHRRQVLVSHIIFGLMAWMAILWWSISSIWYLWALHLGTNPLDWYLLVAGQNLSSAKSTAYWLPAPEHLSLTDVDGQRMASTTRVSYWTCVQWTHACLYSMCSIQYTYTSILHMSIVIYIYMIAIFLLCIPCRWFFHQAGRLWRLQSSRRNHRGRSHDAIDVRLFFWNASPFRQLSPSLARERLRMSRWGSTPHHSTRLDNSLFFLKCVYVYIYICIYIYIYIYIGSW